MNIPYLSTQPNSPLRHAFIALLVALAPLLASAQTGRMFVSAEAYVGMARIVHVGKIVELAPIEHGKPLTEREKTGRKHWRLVLEVSETIGRDPLLSPYRFYPIQKDIDQLVPGQKFLNPRPNP